MRESTFIFFTRLPAPAAAQAQDGAIRCEQRSPVGWHILSYGTTLVVGAQRKFAARGLAGVKSTLFRLVQEVSACKLGTKYLYWVVVFIVFISLPDDLVPLPDVTGHLFLYSRSPRLPFGKVPTSSHTSFRTEPTLISHEKHEHQISATRLPPTEEISRSLK